MNGVSPAYLYRCIKFNIETGNQLWPSEHSDNFVLPGRYEMLEIRRETQSQNVGRMLVFGVQ